MTEARESDVVEDAGEVAVRMSTGNWYILREDPEDRKAFILEGGFGDRYRIAAMDMAQPWGWPKSSNCHRATSARSHAASSARRLHGPAESFTR